DLLLVAELSLELLIDIVGSARLMQHGQGLGPGERRALAIAVERRLAPGVEQVETLLRFPPLARVGGVHVEAKGAAVDLGGAGHHEVHETRLEAAFVEASAKIEP